MSTFLVTTGEDVVDANDGVMSLREAVAAAKAHAGADTIKFAPEKSDGSGIAGNKVVLSASLKITAGNDVTIDGSTEGIYDTITIDGGYAGNPFTTPGFTMVEVAAGATVKLADLTFANGFERGAAGAEGVSGTNGLKGNAGTGDTGLPGSNGNGGTGGTSATTDGKIAVAGVQNAGNLTIERVEFVAMNAFGGAGAVGGNGGDGGSGGKGAPNKSGVGGSGGAGGHAGSGGNGSDGGTAVGAIYNSGTMKLVDTTIAMANAYGGGGGSGGKGGNAGAGGGGGSSTGNNHGGYGGYGGNGGNAGASGDGGDAASAILNVGTITGGGPLATFQGSETAGTASSSSGGGAGSGGQGGTGKPRGDNGLSGTAGKSGADGKDGAKADTSHVLGSHADLTFVKNTFILELASTKVKEGSGVQFAIRRLGDSSGAVSVEWAVSGAGAAEFKAGQALSGKASFAAGEKVKVFTLVTVADGLVEGNESFAVLLKKASTGTALGTLKTANILIDDENHAPTAISLSKSTVDVGASVGTVVGTFSGSDPDGDALTFSLLFNSNGFFKVSGGKLLVAKALDPDRHAYSIFTEASDGQGGTFSKSLVIKLAGYIDGTSAGETLKGTANADRIFGFEGKDTIYGYAGADIIDGGTSADAMYGGDGGDTYIVQNTGDVVIEKSTDTGADLVKSSVSFNLAGQNIETLQLTGSSDINAIGNSNTNTLTGNSGDNSLDGLGGADILSGGGGKDTFQFTKPLGTSNIDTVKDFGGSDIFKLDNAVFTAFASTGALAASAFKNLDLGSADSSDRILYDQDKGDLFYDRDGSGSAFKAVKFAEIANQTTLNAGDFFIV